MYFRLLCGKPPEQWKLINNKLKCNFCNILIDKDYVNHVLVTCDSLKRKRRRYKIYGQSTMEILSSMNSNVTNVLKFLAVVYKDIKFKYY